MVIRKYQGLDFIAHSPSFYKLASHPITIRYSGQTWLITMGMKEWRVVSLLEAMQWVERAIRKMA